MTLRLYDSRLSGNAWRVRLVLGRLGRAYERVTLDLAAGEGRTEAFRARSRFQRIPALELADGRTIVESGAILLYLAEGTDLLPGEPVARAEVTGWLFFEQADLMRFLAPPRFLALTGRTAGNETLIAALSGLGRQGLDRLEGWIAERDWLALGRPTLADYAVYPYVALAHEGGYDMAAYPGVASWLRRVEAEPGWTPLIEEAPA